MTKMKILLVLVFNEKMSYNKKDCIIKLKERSKPIPTISYLGIHTKVKVTIYMITKLMYFIYLFNCDTSNVDGVSVDVLFDVFVEDIIIYDYKL
jgi:hypothetical protein